jgi:hypothetical protein
MPNSQYGEGSGKLLLRRAIPLVGAMLASVALLGATASSASAEPVGLFISGAKSEEEAKQPKFEAEKYTATISSNPLSSLTITAQTGVVNCSGLGFPDSISAATNHLQTYQFFSGCVFQGLTTTITANGCEFNLNVLNAGPPYVGTTDIVCPAEKTLEISNYLNGKKRCTLQLQPQTGIPGVTYENTGSGSSRAVTVNFNLTTVKYNQVPAEPMLSCKAGEYTNGSFVTSMSLVAKK